MNTKRPVIIFSYWFAPSPAVGGKRFSFLAREFARLGYDVHVITHEAQEWTDFKADGSLPLSGHVHRCTESLKLPLAGKGKWRRIANTVLYRLFTPVGFEIFWANAAARKALDVARSLRSGVVIATSPAPAALLAGARVARQLDWPLILDYRDPWSAHAWPRWRVGAIGQWFARRFEGRVVKRSAARVLNTPSMRASFEKFFPRSEIPRNFVIPNGFELAADAPPPPADGPIRIVHAGEIYTGRSLVPVLRAAQRLQARHPDRPIHVVTYGDLPVVERNRIREQELEPWLEVRPRIPFAELFVELQRAHLLLAVVGEHMPYSTPYKVYDYMAAGRPILGIAPRGAALFDLLLESGAGLCIEPDDAECLEHALERFMAGEFVSARGRVDRYRWSNLALQYRNVIENVSGARSGMVTEPPSGASAKLLDL